MTENATEISTPSDAGKLASVDPAPPTASTRLLYAVCRFIAVGLSRVLCPGVISGMENLPKSGAYVIAPLHRSHADFLIVARVTRRRLRYLAKAEVWRFRRLGRFIERLGALPVHRQVTDRDSFNQTLAVLIGGEPLVLFPEGTRGDGPTVNELYEGAAYLALRARVPLIPVGLAGTDRVLHKGRRIPRPSRVRIVIGAPVARPAGSVGSRVPRSMVRTVTDELTAALQQATDDATALLGIDQRRRVTSPTASDGVGDGAGAVSDHGIGEQPAPEQK